MGTIEIDPPESLADEVASEKCVGEGGHFFVRTGERFQEGDFEVQCERCYIMGWEKPDEGDERPTKPILQVGHERALARNERYSLNHPGYLDKSFVIHGPGDLTLTVDYDDVNQEEVLAEAKRLVSTMNKAEKE